MLTKEEREVLLLRVQVYTIAEQAEMLNISYSKVNRITRRLKIRYDALQGTINELPKRMEQRKQIQKAYDIQVEVVNLYQCHLIQ